LAGPGVAGESGNSRKNSCKIHGNVLFSRGSSENCCIRTTPAGIDAGVGGKVGKSGCERDLPKVRVDSREYNMLLVEELVIPAATENRFWKLT